jgi:hypothetical protein
MKRSKQKTVATRLELLASTPSAVHAAAAKRNSAGIMGPDDHQRRRAQRRLDRQQERDAKTNSEPVFSDRLAAVQG